MFKTFSTKSSQLEATLLTFLSYRVKNQNKIPFKRKTEVFTSKCNITWIRGNSFLIIIFLFLFLSFSKILTYFKNYIVL